MRITVEIINALSDFPAVWSAMLPPEQVRNLSTPLASVGEASIIVIEGAEYDATEHRLAFPFGGARVLNLGTTSQTVLVGASDQTSVSAGSEIAPNGVTRGPPLGLGDREFLRFLCSSKVPDGLKEAGQQLAEFVRSLDPAGDLKHKPPRHVSFPDNWVTFQIQPQVREIMVTFKGAISTRLKSASARRPYQGFKVRGLEDVEEAKRVLQGAKRRY